MMLLLLGMGNLPGLLISSIICLREEQSKPASSFAVCAVSFLCSSAPMPGTRTSQGGLQVALGGLSHPHPPGAGRCWGNVAALSLNGLRGTRQVHFGRSLSPREGHLGQQVQGGGHSGAVHQLPTAQTLHPPPAGTPGQPRTIFSVLWTGTNRQFALLLPSLPAS